MAIRQAFGSPSIGPIIAARRQTYGYLKISAGKQQNLQRRGFSLLVVKSSFSNIFRLISFRSCEAHISCNASSKSHD